MTMSMNLGANGLKEVYMQIANLDGLSIELIQTSDNKDILRVDISAKNRKEAVSMTTNKDETVDQFCARLRSMLRALWNVERREPAPLPDLNTSVASVTSAPVATVGSGNKK